MVEDECVATKVVHKIDRVFKRPVIKVYYQCPHCSSTHSHGATTAELERRYMHRGSHCPCGAPRNVRIAF